MRGKLVIPVFVAFTILLVVLIPMIDSAFAKPTDLPPQVKITRGPNHSIIYEYGNITAALTPFMTVVDDPAHHVTPSGTYESVGMLILPTTQGTFGCTGTLISDIHILTAAHCVTDDFGTMNLIDGATITFANFAGSPTLSLNEPATAVHPGFLGYFVQLSNDVAVLELDGAAPAGIPRLDLDRKKNDDTGVVFEKVGYGNTGLFETGTFNTGFGLSRNGLNTYDDTADALFKKLGLVQNIHFERGDFLLSDTDDGTPEHDAAGIFLNKHNLGLGLNEIGTDHGDSGGPNIVDGKITAITAWGLAIEGTDLMPPKSLTSDCHPNIIEGINMADSSCGEFFGDLRVSQHADFIDSVLGISGGSSEPNCPPNSKSPQCN